MRYGSQIVPRPQYFADPNQQYQAQSQVFQQSLTSDQAQIRYYIYQNMQFLVNLLYSMEEVLRYFKTNPDHPMVTIGWNKIILQINLATSINCDLQQTYRNSPEALELEKSKENAKILFIEATRHLSSELQGYAAEYINNSLSKYTNQKQVPLQPSRLNYNFNQKVVQDVFDAMSQTDQELNMIKRSKSYNIPNTAHVIQTAQYYQFLSRQFQQKTYQKLSVNFPSLGTPNKPSKAEFQYPTYPPQQFSPPQMTNLAQSAIYSSPQPQSNKVPFQYQEQPPSQIYNQSFLSYQQAINQFKQQRQQNFKGPNQGFYYQ